MEKICDYDQGITWVKDDLSYEANQIVEELDSWKSDNIKEYVSGNTSLGYTFRGICDYEKDVDQFFGFSDNKLVSAILMRKNNLLDEKSMFFELKKHIENNEKNKNFAFEKDPLSNSVAEQIIEDRSFNEIYYLVVNPNEQNKGYGTRAVGSIKNKHGLLLPNREFYKLGTKIHYKNKPSMTVFYKNGFKQINKPPHMTSELTKFFLEDMER